MASEMENEQVIVLAMAAAVASDFQPNPFYLKRPTEAAYLELRNYLAGRYPAVTGDLLNVGPGSAERQALLRQQLRDSGAADDPRVLALAKSLARLVVQSDPVAAESVFASVADLERAAQ